MADDLKRLLRLAKRQGATVTRHRGHFKVRTPQGLVVMSGTPSNPSMAARAAERDLRKIGIATTERRAR